MSRPIARSEAPYLQIAGQIRNDIENGVLAEGAKVPSAREIMATWQVALATATKVHARLRSEGLVESVSGVGTVVRVAPLRGGAQQLRSSHSRGRIYGIDEHAEIRTAEIVDAPEHVADALELDQGAAVIRRERVTKHLDDPIALSVSWFSAVHQRVAPKLLKRSRIPEGTFSYLAEQLGRVVATGREETQAGEASADEAVLLQVQASEPVLRTHVWFYDETGGVIEFGESVHPAGRWLAHDFSLTQ